MREGQEQPARDRNCTRGTGTEKEGQERFGRDINCERGIETVREGQELWERNRNGLERDRNCFGGT